MEGVKRGQLHLRWSDELRWDEVAPSLRAEVRALLRDLLRRASRGDSETEVGHDQ